MTTKNIDCAVDTQDDLGVYANAFRILQDGPDAILDFCLYSERENVAKIVSRIRVPPSFLGVIMDRLKEATEEDSVADTPRVFQFAPFVEGYKAGEK